MGTSISQASERTISWNSVLACYANAEIPESWVINEIWRASDQQEFAISAELKSSALFDYYQIVDNSTGANEALTKINLHIFEHNNNSVVLEFAKRVVNKAYTYSTPANAWKALLFSEITKYYISRDASGFVGEKYRNKTVNDLIAYKSRIGDKISRFIMQKDERLNTLRTWQSFVDSSIKELKSREWQ
ncbi:MAG TPA: hypothetical protein PLS50_03935 [Candidatus Dojkabacteria bacterium]|nr:hypothetical protein [Candidatus Dojkabacteria bacterium]